MVFQFALFASDVQSDSALQLVLPSIHTIERDIRPAKAQISPMEQR